MGYLCYYLFIYIFWLGRWLEERVVQKTDSVCEIPSDVRWQPRSDTIGQELWFQNVFCNYDTKLIQHNIMRVLMELICQINKTFVLYVTTEQSATMKEHMPASPKWLSAKVNTSKVYTCMCGKVQLCRSSALSEKWNVIWSLGNVGTLVKCVWEHICLINGTFG